MACIQAAPQISFQTNALSVSQQAGAIVIPIQVTGDLIGDTANDLPSIQYESQSGTAIDGTHYDGLAWYENNVVGFDRTNSTVNVSIPIYYTGVTADRFFTVILTGPRNAGLGSITSVTVTILAEPEVPPISFSFGAGNYAVSQGAGSIQIPVSYTGTPAGSEVWLEYRTQPGTANGSDDYEGTSSSRIDFSPGSNSALITIPIYNTGSTVEKFFNVLLVDTSEGQLGTPAAAAVKIWAAKPPPQVQILTKSARRGSFTIYGRITNIKDSEIRRVTLSINGSSITVRGKRNWLSRVRATSTGNYLMTVKAYLRNGKVLTQQEYLRVRR